MSTLRRGEVNRLAGTLTLNGSTDVSVNAPEMTSESVVLLTVRTVGGTQGAHPTVTPTAAGFNVRGTAGDTSVYNYVVL